MPANSGLEVLLKLESMYFEDEEKWNTLLEFLRESGRSCFEIQKWEIS